MPENLIRLIAKAKPKAALLTSFTFGLSYFEAAILPALLRVGCGNVSVLVDEGQYQASLCESHSSFAGRSYRICAVRAPGGGIFHPKLAYFECEEGDVLLVSSGNLTFSGQGGNLECLDAVSANQTPEVFEDLGGFFRDLAGALPEESGQVVRMLRAFAGRSAAQARKYQATASDKPRSSWLIHTLNTPVAEQLAELVPTLGVGFKRLTVMSPYHAPDAEPILAFAKKVGVPKVDLCLDPHSHSIALDAKRFGSPKDVSFVLPDLGEDARESHAKWFEIAMADGVFVMTGSVNATDQSFASKKNVEVSLARVLAKSVVKWQKAVPREVKYFPFPFTGRTPGIGVVDATLQADGQLVGLIQGVSFAAGTIEVELLQEGTSVLKAGDVALSAAGRFRWTIETKFTEADGSLQVQVQGVGFNALGWVSNELQLEATEADRQKMAAVNRILSDKFNADDVYELFSLLIGYTTAPPTRTATSSQSSANESEQSKLTPFSLDSWLISGEPSTRAGLLGASSGRGFDAFYAWINSTSKSKGGTVEGGSSDKAGDEEDGTGKDGAGGGLLSDAQDKKKDAADREEKEEQNSRLIQKLLQVIPQKLKENPSHPGAADLVRVAGAFAVRHALQARAVAAPDAYASQPCLNWLDVYSRIGLQKEAVRAIESTIVAMGCLAASLAQASGRVEQVAAQVKEDFQRFGLVGAEESVLKERCRNGVQHRAFDLLDKETKGQVENMVLGILAVETGADIVSRLLSQLESGGLVALSKADTDLLGVDFGNAVRNSAKSTEKRYGRVRDLEKAFCPCCFVTLSADTVKRLRRTHVAVCTSGMYCGRPLIWLPQVSDV